MKAACNLVRKFNPKKIYCNFIIELVNEGLNGIHFENIQQGMEELRKMGVDAPEIV